MKRSVLASLATFGFLLTAVAAFIALTLSSGGGVEQRLDSLAGELTACIQEGDKHKCGEDAVLAGMESGVPPLAMTEFLLERYDSQDPMPLLCHQAVHLVGHYIDVMTDSLEPFHPYLASCWGGLLDGMVESQPIDAELSRAAAQLTSFCSTLKSKLPETHDLGQPFRYCWHPFGHALWASYHSAEKAVAVCNRAAPVGLDRYWCTQAVMMQMEDLLAGSRKLPPTAKAAFTTIDDRCEKLSRGDRSSYEGCEAGYFRAVQSEMVALYVPFLARCLEFSEILRDTCQEVAAETVGSAVVHSGMSIKRAIGKFCPQREFYAGCFIIASELMMNSERYTVERAADEVMPAIRELLPGFADEFRALLIDEYGLSTEYSTK